MFHINHLEDCVEIRYTLDLVHEFPFSTTLIYYKANGCVRL
jgi:hypothetical protein